MDFLFGAPRKAIGLLGAFALAAAPLSVALAQEAPPPAASSPAPRSASTRVDHWIAKLHSELKITPDQAPQWDAFTAVLRDNATAMDSAYEQAAKLPPTATAVDDLKAYGAVEKARAANIEKLEPAFETLYNSLSPSQKQAADTYFRQRAQQHMHRP